MAQPAPTGPDDRWTDQALDESGRDPVDTTLIHRHLLAGGQPPAGKSGLLNTITAHAALRGNAPGRE